MEAVRISLIIQLFGISAAVYKQWIPNTNFENALNWDKSRNPCAQDAVDFDSRNVISVFVQSTHSLQSMNMPWNGEFILAPGAGFAAAGDFQDAACGPGSDIKFKETMNYNWMDPNLWHAAVSTNDLENGKYVFAVHEEQVPCQYDDVIFQPETSFRVNLEPSEGIISLKSISILGQTFNRHEDFARYMETNTAKKQFHGPGVIQITNTRCMDTTGCACGNTGELQNICSALKQYSENECPGVICKDPLKPIGHCCEICGAIISLEYSPEFNIEMYRNQLVHGFLSLPKYAGVQMAISKVYVPQRFLSIAAHQAAPEIQIVLIDDRNGSETGTSAQLLASDIMKDIADHGTSFGIAKGKMQVATGSNLSGLGDNRASAGTIASSIAAVLLFLLLTGVLVYLYRTKGLRFQTRSFPRFWKTTDDSEFISSPADKGFVNPMFDIIEGTSTSNPQGLYSGEEALKGVTPSESAIYFVNPLYDESDSSI